MDNSLQTAQWNVVPFRKETFQLDGKDRSQGEVIPSLEGNFLYVETCDYPVLLSFVNRLTLERQCIVAHVGLQIHTPFKEITVTHPLLTTTNGVPYNMSLITGHGDCPREVYNQYAFPFSGLPPSAIVTESGIALTLGLFVPPGARWCSDLNLTLTATTLTSASWQVLTGITGTLRGIPAPQLTSDPGGTVYAGPNFAQGAMDITTPYAGVFRARDFNIPLADTAQQLAINCVGTGIVFGASVVGGVRAAFA